MTRIAEKKLAQLGGDVCGVLVRTQDSKVMAVSEHGRCTRLDAGVMGAEPIIPSERFTVEPHGSGYAIYRGRGADHHGENLGHVTECMPYLPKMLERALNAQERPEYNVDREFLVQLLTDRQKRIDELEKQVAESASQCEQEYPPLAKDLREKFGAQGGQGAEPVTNDRRAFWQKLQSFVDDYVSGYEFRGDGDYTPNEKEQFLIEDCVAGLLHELSQEGYFYTQPQPSEVEPVAYMFSDDYGRTKIVSGKETAEHWCPPGETVTPLYTQPQPAQQGVPEETEAMVDAAVKVFEDAGAKVDLGWLGEACRAYVAASFTATTPQPAQQWTPSGIEYDRAIHHNPDAKAWADLFMQTFPHCGADPETMHGWFANAMMAMYDHLKNSQPTQQGSVPEGWRECLQEMVQAMHDYEMSVDEDAPYKHRAMMDRAHALLSTPTTPQPEGDGWKPAHGVSDELPEVGKPVLGYHPDWVDVDFCADGIRECFLFGDGSEWQSARWDGYSDQWIVEDGAPQLWQEHPQPPAGQEGDTQ